MNFLIRTLSLWIIIFCCGCAKADDLRAVIYARPPSIEAEFLTWDMIDEAREAAIKSVFKPTREKVWVTTQNSRVLRNAFLTREEAEEIQRNL